MGPIGQNFQILTSVDSTNNYAMALVQKGAAQHGDAWFAWEQTAGKGQRNRQWVATPGENIVLSVVLAPGPLLLNARFSLGIAVALACHDLLGSLIKENISIKWPNDLYWNDRKAGGILIENQVRGEQWQYAIAGIGINVNQVRFPEGVRNPVSLKQILGHDLDVLLQARRLCEFLEMRYSQLVNGETEVLWEAYNRVLYQKDQQVKLRRNNIVFSTTIRGVDQQGLLLTENALPEQFRVGEVEWVL